MNYCSSSINELKQEYKLVKDSYDKILASNLSLDLSRGKPGTDVLALLPGFETCLNDVDCKGTKGDYRNYGLIRGIPEAQEFFAEVYNIPAEHIIVGGNSSLNMMFDTVSRCMNFGTCDSIRPWEKEEQVKFICPAPGYDRHFAICKQFGIEMLTVSMLPTGPDMDQVEELVKDPLVKGIWCCPMYSNPDGITYSDETVVRLAKMKTGAVDFRIFWDNAYAVHHLNQTQNDVLLDIFSTCQAYGTENRVYYFASTSKISYPGSGVAIMACNEANLKQILPILSIQTIGYDKLNQLRHVRYFKTADNLRNHMIEVSKVLAPKFNMVLSILENNLGENRIAHWTKPKGGYFISLYVKEGTAKRVYQLMKEAGIILTTVGATYPYGIDPKDSNIRIAPTYPSLNDLEKAMTALTICVKLAALEALLEI